MGGFHHDGVKARTGHDGEALTVHHAQVEASAAALEGDIDGCGQVGRDPEVAGQGHERLRARGIQVEVGLLADEARRAHAGHIGKITQSRPHVLLKLAVSSDGKAGLAGRKKAFITSDEAQARVHRLREMSDAILVGIGTVLADNPQLTCRLPGMFERSPLRVVLDARLRTPLSLAVVSTVRETPTVIVCSTKASPIAEDILVQKGVKVVRVGEQNGKLDLDQVLKALAGEGITRLMVEGGPRVAASFVGAGLVDEVALLRGEKAIGDSGIDALEGMALSALTDGLALRGSETLGPDTLERYERA